MLKEISISFILILSLVSVRAQTHIFVASDGNDQQAGSIEKPLRSLHAAVEKLKSIKKTHANEQVIISLRGGEYAIDQSIRLDQSLSGTANKPTIIAAYAQEKVTLTGGIKIDPTQLADVKEAKWRSRIHPAAKGKVKTVRLEDGQGKLDEGLFPHGFGYDPHKHHSSEQHVVHRQPGLRVGAMAECRRTHPQDWRYPGSGHHLSGRESAEPQI